MTSFKKILAASVAISALLGATQASAADLYTPPPVPVSTWTGLWIGGGLGYGFKNTELDGGYYGEFGDTATGGYNAYNEGASLSGIGGQGWTGRIGAGWDFQLGDTGVNPDGSIFSNGFVLGIMGDYNFAKIDSSASLYYGEDGCASEGKSCYDDYYDAAKLTVRAGDNWFVGGRFGWLLNPNTLIYGLVGYSEWDMKAKLGGDYITDGGEFDPYTKSWNAGGITWGLGLEGKMSNWDALSWKMEYRYHNLDSEKIVDDVYTDFQDGSIYEVEGFRADAETNIQTVMFTVNYRFDWKPY